MMIPMFLQFVLAAFGIEPSMADAVIRTLSVLCQIIA
jgi:hypothetical protein